MSQAPIDELVVPFDSSRPAEKAARWRRLFRGRVVTFFITIAVLVGIYLWRRSQGDGGSFVAIYGVIFVVSLVWLVGYLVLWLIHRNAVRKVGIGTALRVDRRGITVVDTFAAWAEITSVRAVKGPMGVGPLLQVERTTGAPMAVPFDHMIVPPSTIDMTARAYSGGRHGVDLNALES